MRPSTFWLRPAPTPPRPCQPWPLLGSPAKKRYTANPEPSLTRPSHTTPQLVTGRPAGRPIRRQSARRRRRRHPARSAPTCSYRARRRPLRQSRRARKTARTRPQAPRRASPPRPIPRCLPSRPPSLPAAVPGRSASRWPGTRVRSATSSFPAGPPHHAIRVRFRRWRRLRLGR